MSMFTLAISCLNTSNLPWFMDLTTFQFLCNIALYSIGLGFYHQSHPQLGVVFALAPSLYSFWSYFSTDLQWYIGHLLAWGVHVSLSCLFAFLYYSWGSQGKNTEMVCNSLLQDHVLSELSPMIRPPWVSHSFTELDKAVVHVISLISFLWLWFQFVCPLMPFLSTYCLTGVSLTLCGWAALEWRAPKRRYPTSKVSNSGRVEIPHV